MNSPLTVGVTGGIGSGKSLICRIFNILSIPVYDADSRAKWVMFHDRDVREKVKELLGEKAYSDDTLNREYIASRTFHDPALLNSLNEIVHPAVGRDFDIWCAQHSTSPYVIKEAALLIESGSYKTLDVLVNIHAPVDLRIKRVLERDPFRDISQIENIIARQISDEERMKKADHTIFNDDQHMVIPGVISLDKLFRSLISS
jgi:dephospho-CoA kinase